jgi:hypothetical protein
MVCRATHCFSELDALTLNPALAGFFVPEFHGSHPLVSVLFIRTYAWRFL